jgi:transposase
MLPTGVRIYVACGVTDMRKGFDGLAALIQTALELDRKRSGGDTWRRVASV